MAASEQNLQGLKDTHRGAVRPTRIAVASEKGMHDIHGGNARPAGLMDKERRPYGLPWTQHASCTTHEAEALTPATKLDRTLANDNEQDKTTRHPGN